MTFRAPPCILRPITFFSLENSCRLWDNVDKHDRAREVRDNNLIKRVCFAWWKLRQEYRHTRKKYIIIIAFPRQKWLRERVLISCCTYVASVVNYARTACFSVTSCHSTVYCLRWCELRKTIHRIFHAMKYWNRCINKLCRCTVAETWRRLGYSFLFLRPVFDLSLPYFRS